MSTYQDDSGTLDTIKAVATAAGGSSGSYDTTKSVMSYAATAATVGGPVGATAGALAVTAATIFDTLKGVFNSPSPEWPQTNTIAVPTATQLTTRIVNDLGAGVIPSILTAYVAKLKAYIKGSPHNPTQTDNFVAALQTEVIEMNGGFRPDAFPFDTLEQDQLAWAIWLHAHWLYGGVSKNEITNGNANRKFTDSLIPTLQAAVLEATGSKIDVQTGNIPTPPPAKVTTPTTFASIASSPLAIVTLVGIAVGVLYFSAKGK